MAKEISENTKFTISVKTVSSIIGGVVAILGSIWALDNHYASAADVEKVQKGLEAQIVQMRQEKIEDELFMLDIKKQQQNGKLSPLDAALYERYTRKLKESQQKLINKGNTQ